MGWAMSDRADQALASDALAMALGAAAPPRERSITVTKALNTPASSISSNYKKSV
jgi:hypothetical protein